MPPVPSEPAIESDIRPAFSRSPAAASAARRVPRGEFDRRARPIRGVSALNRGVPHAHRSIPDALHAGELPRPLDASPDALYAGDIPRPLDALCAGDIPRPFDALCAGDIPRVFDADVLLRDLQSARAALHRAQAALGKSQSALHAVQNLPLSMIPARHLPTHIRACAGGYSDIRGGYSELRGGYFERGGSDKQAGPGQAGLSPAGTE